jgi:hypothetical protein
VRAPDPAQRQLVSSQKHLINDNLRVNIVAAVDRADKPATVAMRIAKLPAAALEAGKTLPGTEWIARVFELSKVDTAALMDSKDNDW